MQIKKIWLCVIAAVTILSQSSVLAQSNTINTFSVYSMYGLGDIQSQGTLATRSMGSAGVAARSFSTINLLNPASYSVALRRGMLLNYGMEGSSYFAAQKAGGEVQKSSYTTANFQNIALQMPITKGLGMGFSVTPFSSVGYRQLDNSISPNVGYVETENSGSGTISEVKLGIGWEIMTGLSIGAAMQYYWGDIDRRFDVAITPTTATTHPLSVAGDDNLSVSNIKGQVGVQAEIVSNKKRTITTGFTMDIGGDLNPRSVRSVAASEGSNGVYAQNDTTKISVILPRQLTAGVEYEDSKLNIVADLNYQGWAGQNNQVEYTGSGMKVAYNNVLTGRVGVQYIPRRGDVRHYFNRINYRFGARYGGYQYTFADEELMQYAVTAGMGFPIRVIGISQINLGFEWSGLGSMKEVMVDSKKIGLVRQNSFKFSLGFTLFGDDYWFQRPQID